MIEDKLDHDERLRLECLAQAIARSGMSQLSDEVLLKRAKTFEDYVKGR